MRYCILKIWGIRVSFGCERSYSPRRVSNFNSNESHGGIYPHKISEAAAAMLKP